MISKCISAAISLATCLLLAGCKGTAEKEVPEEPPVFQVLPCDDASTRTFRGDNYEVLWNAGDLVSVFFSTANMKYSFAGKDGDNGGALKSADNSFYAGAEIPCNFAVYPWTEETSITTSGIINYTLPATQTYAENSFGQGANLMCAATKDLDDKVLMFYNALGYIQIKLYGSARIAGIKLSSNGGEPLCGPCKVSVPYHAGPVLTMDPGSPSEVTLDCGGVLIGTDAATATIFTIMIPPTDFSQGFTVEVTDTDGKVMTKGTSKEYSITRNDGVAMPAFEMKGETPGPDIPELPGLLYESGLPVLYVFTPDGVAVDQKETWITGSTAYLKDADGTVTDLGTASIRGRGNTTWNYVKKPYAFKLDTKASLLGMPKDKRWDLLANYIDRTRLRNDLALELGRRLSGLGLDWTPKGKYVELVLNGTHLGNYYLCEHIKIAKDRVPVKEMKSTDVREPAVTGGYLLELGIELDETNQFLTDPFPDVYPYNRHLKTGSNYQLPVMIKEPDDETLVTEQFDWIRNFVNRVQESIVSVNGSWRDDVDMDSFICWMFVQEVVGNYEPFHPKSVYMHKDREGKLMMGPLWDFDYGTFKDNYYMTPVYHYSVWYPYMLKDGEFVARVKELWPQAKAIMLQVCDEYSEKYTQATATSESMALAVSIDRDWARWSSLGGQPSTNGDESLGIWVAFNRMTSRLRARINQMQTEVDNM